MLGMAGSANVQGEDQKKLDVLANDVFISLLTVRVSEPLDFTLHWHYHVQTMRMPRKANACRLSAACPAPC